MHLESALAVTLAIGSVVRQLALHTERVLRRRWPDTAVKVIDDSPVDAILNSARSADTVVVGARGHSKLRRWMLGSVSSRVVRGATSSVLVVKGNRLAPRHLVIGYDGSPNAKAAIDLVAKLKVPRNGRVTLLQFFDSINVPGFSLLSPRAAAALARKARAITADRKVQLHRSLARVAARLERAGWHVRVDARPGVAARNLVNVPVELRAHLVVVGAQGTGALRRVLLGSVAETVLNRSPLSVLLVR